MNLGEVYRAWKQGYGVWTQGYGVAEGLDPEWRSLEPWDGRKSTETPKLVYKLLVISRLSAYQRALLGRINREVETPLKGKLEFLS